MKTNTLELAILANKHIALTVAAAALLKVDGLFKVLAVLNLELGNTSNKICKLVLGVEGVEKVQCGVKAYYPNYYTWDGRITFYTKNGQITKTYNL